MSEFVKNSFLDDFDIPVITHESIKQSLIKITKTCTVQKSKSLENLSVEDRLKLIQDEVFKVLSKYKGFVRVIYTKEELEDYIDKAISVDCIAIDTETNKSVDPLTCKLMGLCLYVPNTRPVYVPISHCKVGTYDLLPNQVSLEDASRIIHKIKEYNVKSIYHNGKFDIRVLKNTLGEYLPIWWDTLLAAQVLDENESAKLKYQYRVHVDPTMNTYDIEKLFNGIPYEWVSPEIFALYSAIDAYDTFLLQREQQEKFEEIGRERQYKLFTDIEMPVSPITAKMEDDGISVDRQFLEKLNEKYKADKDNALEKLQSILAEYKPTIEHLQEIGKLDNPINFESSIQLKIVLYDILKTKPLEEGSTATDKATLKLLGTPFTKALLNFRHYAKLVNSFTEPLQEKISADGKLHSNFFQMGSEGNNVKTGRFSCIAKGQKVEVLGGQKNIEDVQVGDYVYCYDENGMVQLSKVLNKFNSGIKKCVKITWQSTGTHKSGALICTPEHLIRLKSGEWVRADELHRFDKLSHVRRGMDNVHGRPRIFGSNKFCKLEQEIVKYSIYKCHDSRMNIHHIDGNKMNNSVDNLVVLSSSEHTRLHNAELIALRKLDAKTFHDVKYNAKRLSTLKKTIFERRTKSEVEQLLLQCNCKLTKCGHDFESVKRWINLYGIDLVSLKEKCNGLDCQSFSQTYFACNGSVTKISQQLHIGTRKCHYYIDKYNLCMNHMVQSVKEDVEHEVYDLEVGNYHNFIVSEICVHNCTNPNLQQMPSKEKLVRMMFQASCEEREIESVDDEFEINSCEEIETRDGWKFANALKVGDLLSVDGTMKKIKNIENNSEKYLIRV